MIAVFFHESELKHVASIAKASAKDTSNELRNVYLILRHGRAYLAALDGHSMAIYSKESISSQPDAVFFLSWENVLALTSIKSKVPAITFAFDEDSCKVERSGFSCTAQKMEQYNFITRIFERIEGIARSGKLINSKALHIVGAKQLQYVFPDKTAALEIVQPADNPRDFQICTDPSFPNYCAVLMPMAATKERMGKAIKQARAFFAA
jgi:hypothetical protein